MFFEDRYIVSIFNEKGSKVLGRMSIEGVSVLQAYFMARQMLQLYNGKCWAAFHIFKDGEEAIMKVIEKGDKNG